MQSSVTAEALVGRLAKLGPETDQHTIDSILARSEEALPYLIQVATQKEYWDLDRGYSVWAPICAIHLLAVMGGKQAQEAIEQAIRTHYDETADWLTEDMPSVLAALGPKSFHLLSGIISDSRLDMWVRAGATRALLMISRNNEETRNKSIVLLREVVGSEGDKDARTMLLDGYIEFKDEDSLGLVRSLFERKMVDEAALTYDEVMRVYSGEYDHLEHDVPGNPLDIFKPGSFYWNNNKPSGGEPKRELKSNYLQTHAITHDGGLRAYGQDKPVKIWKKTGRNDPCPCGSGKKYKRCCGRHVK